MDTRESRSPEEEREHLKEVKEPEDFEHPEPDEDQPEAKQPSHGMDRLLLLVIAIVGILAAAMLYFSGVLD